MSDKLQTAMKAAAQEVRDASMKPVTPAGLVAERKNQHGDWAEQALLAHDLKKLIRDRTTLKGTGGSKLTVSQQEALEMICVKISRICCGDPNHPDHFQDIMGYALLGLEGHKR